MSHPRATPPAPPRAASRPPHARDPQLGLTRRERAQLEDVEERLAAAKLRAPPVASTSVHVVRFCWDHDRHVGCRDWTRSRGTPPVCVACGRARPAPGA